MGKYDTLSSLFIFEINGSCSIRQGLKGAKRDEVCLFQPCIRSGTQGLNHILNYRQTCIKWSTLFSGCGQPFEGPAELYLLFIPVLNGGLVRGDNQNITRKERRTFHKCEKLLKSADHRIYNLQYSCYHLCMMQFFSKPVLSGHLAIPKSDCCKIFSIHIKLYVEIKGDRIYRINTFWKKIKFANK